MTPYAIPNEIETELRRMFDELDAILFDSLPDSLIIAPAQLIRETIRRRFGVLLSEETILNAYLSYAAENAGCFEGDWYE